jgi:YD repeat-containing protein
VAASSGSSTVRYDVSRGPAGTRVASTSLDAPGDSEIAEFDTADRLVHRETGSGLVMDWSYPSDGSTIGRAVIPTGEAFGYSASADRRTVRLSTPGGTTWEMDADPRGYPNTLRVGGTTVVTLDWLPDGRLLSASTTTRATRLQYEEDGRLSSILLTPPGSETRFTQWAKLQLDVDGNLTRLTDHEGNDVSMIRRDGLLEIQAPRSTARVRFDAAGRMTAVDQSNGFAMTANYGKDGAPREIRVTREGRHAGIRFDRGRLRSFRDFGGTERRITYETVGQLLVPARIESDMATVRYRYSPSGLLVAAAHEHAYEARYERNGDGRVSRITIEPDPSVDRRGTR